MIRLPVLGHALFRPFFGGGSSPTCTLPPTPKEEHERKYYDGLVDSGGRPLYPINLLGNVAEDPQAHCEMLRPWQYSPKRNPLDWDIFQRQLAHWREFLLWQMHNRRAGDTRYINGEATYNIFVWKFRLGPQTYTEAVKNRLAQYNFVRPFQFHDDAEQQDKLTTWIEYLGFACAVHNRYAHGVKIGQPEYDKAWKTLVDAKVLRPFETEEFIYDINAAFYHQSEENTAYQAVKLAEAALPSAQKAEINQRESRCSKSAAGIHSQSAQSRLDEKKELLASIMKRNGLVDQFHITIGDYKMAKHNATHHSAILQWVLEQVPLVEAQMNESGVNEPGVIKTGPNPMRGTKRGHDEDS